MGRPKGFSREEVLPKTLSVFWEKGLSGTTVQDIERVTRVNKSGLYSEFRNKEDIFLASLQYYLENRGGEAALSANPKGWDNIQGFWKSA
jgi:AcrR family transcriptional regulator